MRIAFYVVLGAALLVDLVGFFGCCRASSIVSRMEERYKDDLNNGNNKS